LDVTAESDETPVPQNPTLESPGNDKAKKDETAQEQTKPAGSRGVPEPVGKEEKDVGTENRRQTGRGGLCDFHAPEAGTECLQLADERGR
jgi:hypothetical protein